MSESFKSMVKREFKYLMILIGIFMILISIIYALS